MRRVALILLAAAACTGRKAEPQQHDGPWMADVADRVTDVDRSEEAASAIGKAVKARLIKGIKARDGALTASALTDDFEARFTWPGEGEKIEDPNVDIWHASADRAAAPIDRARFLAKLDATLAGLASVDRASWHTFRSFLAGAKPRRARQQVHLHMGGARSNGARLHFLGTVDVEAIETADGWKLRRLAIVEGDWTESRLAPFRDLAGQVGFTLNPSEENAKALQAVIDNRALFTTGGLTALDFEGDGDWDVLATQADRETILFENDGKGGFVRKKLPLITRPSQSGKFYLWIDLDNDRKEELVGTQVLEYAGGRARLGLYTFAGGKMRRVDRALELEIPRWMRRISFEGITPCDVNGDGLLDLIVVGYSHLESQPTKNYVDAQDGMRNLLFINKGGLRFTEEALERGLVETRYSFVAMCHDFDRDGDPDIFVGNDYGKNDYYRNEGGGRFVHDATHPLHLGNSFTMGLALADYDNTGQLSLYLSNMYSHSGNRIVPLNEDLNPEMRATLMGMLSGNTLYRQEGDRWVDTTDQAGVRVGEWAWGSAFFDFDDDGDKDLYVVNGYTTHSDPEAPDF